MIQAGIRTERPRYRSSSTSSFSIPSRCAVAGLKRAALSHDSFVSGLGSSCSQPLFANRPSQIVGSGRKTISRPSDAAVDAASTQAISLTCGATALGLSAVPSITPASSAVRQACSKSPGNACRFQ